MANLLSPTLTTTALYHTLTNLDIKAYSKFLQDSLLKDFTIRKTGQMLFTATFQIFAKSTTISQIPDPSRSSPAWTTTARSFDSKILIYDNLTY